MWIIPKSITWNYPHSRFREYLFFKKCYMDDVSYDSVDGFLVFTVSSDMPVVRGPSTPISTIMRNMATATTLNIDMAPKLYSTGSKTKGISPLVKRLKL